MTWSYRRRAALTLAGALIGTPLAAGAVASARAPSVIFSGQPLPGLGTLLCPSTPNVWNLAVSPGTTVDFVNRLGRTATLWVGDSKKSLPDKSLVPVTFAQGPARIVVQMLPDCALDLGSHDQMTVTVRAPTAHPTAVPASPSRAGGGGSGATSPSTSATKPSASAAKPDSEPSPATGSPHASTSSRAAAPVPTGGPDTSHGAATGDDGPLSPVTEPTIAVGDPVLPTNPSHGASGLLTLIAAVGVVGVSAAVIRAIIAQRTSRAFIA